MTEAKRGPGRPPKVRLAATAFLPPEPRVDDTALVSEVLASNPSIEVFAPKVVDLEATAAPKRMIEVEIIRKYVPSGQLQEIKWTVPPGTVMELPVMEATRALKFGIARATDRTFAL